MDDKLLAIKTAVTAFLTALGAFLGWRGIICPQFSAAWVGLSMLAILLDDWLRYWLWGEERPKYKLL